MILSLSCRSRLCRLRGRSLGMVQIYWYALPIMVMGAFFPPRPCFSLSGRLLSFPDRFFGFPAAFLVSQPVFSFPDGHLSFRTAILVSRPFFSLPERLSFCPSRHLGFMAGHLASRDAIFRFEPPSSFWSAHLSSQSFILTSRTVILARFTPPRENAAPGFSARVGDSLRSVRAAPG